MEHRFLSKWKEVLFIVVCIFFISVGSAMGAGFALVEQSVGGLGNAFAGGAASAEDATTVFYNPAGMTRLSDLQLVVGTHIIIPSVKFHNEDSTHVLQGSTGQALSGGNGGDGGVTKLVPNLYYTKKLGDRLVMGIGINVPFGLATKYDDDWVGRYHAVESDVLTININPSMAYKINDQLSVGAGFSAQYIKAKLSQAIDFGTIAFIQLGASTATQLGLAPQSSDGFASLEGDSWGYGFNLGILYEFTKNTRIGAAYRSRIKQSLEGDIDYKNVPSVFSSAFQDKNVKADITLPDSLSISFFHQFNPQWRLMADFTWTNWSVFKELKVVDNGGNEISKTIYDWQDSYRYSLGVTYLPNNNLLLRAGTAYDTSAVPNAQRRTPRIPDEDRVWLALGAGYKVSKRASLDIGYAHLFIKDPKIYRDLATANDKDKMLGGLKGTYDAQTNILSAQLTVTF
jgi:long-chain fatty acid transport protein